jgi:hypothetical protein
MQEIREIRYTHIYSMLYTVLIISLMPIMIVLFYQALSEHDPFTKRSVTLVYCCIWLAASVMFWQ